MVRHHTCSECKKHFTCRDRSWDFQGKCIAVYGCRCPTCMMALRLRDMKVWGRKWAKESDTHIFIRCWGITVKKVRELRDITKMVI